MATSTAKRTVELFYDVVSPHSWFAFEILCRYQNKWAIKLQLRPFFLGAIMNETGNRSSALVPSKRKYMQMDLLRMREFYQVPYNPKKDVDVILKKGSLMAQRFLAAIDRTCPQNLEPMSRALWTRCWSKGENVDNIETLFSACLEVGIAESMAEHLCLRVTEQEIKRHLRSYTDKALKHGAFGAPTIICHVNNEELMFSGIHTILSIAHALGEDWHGPLLEYSQCSMDEVD